MKLYLQVLICLLMIMGSACSNGANLPDGSDNTARDVETLNTPYPAPNEEHADEKAGSDCLSDEINPIGQAIAEEFESTTYEMVMNWFCNGAEFEDILVALETEEMTSTPAQETLEMLADGFTWEEIWLLTGLTD